MMTSSEFQSRLQKAREANRDRDAHYLREGKISPSRCAPRCALNWLFTMLLEATERENWDTAFQALVFVDETMEYWEREELYGHESPHPSIMTLSEFLCRYGGTEN